MPTHPPCGLYRTTQPLGDLPAGRLVSFHDHGDPGPGVYLPKAWSLNRVEWHEKGQTVPGPEWSATLEPLPAEGLYRVKTAFHCCEQQCVRFEPNQLLQLGYDAAATPILFTPEWSSRGLGFPERGTKLAAGRFGSLELLNVARGPEPRVGGMVH